MGSKKETDQGFDRIAEWFAGAFAIGGGFSIYKNGTSTDGHMLLVPRVFIKVSSNRLCLLDDLRDIMGGIGSTTTFLYGKHYWETTRREQVLLVVELLETSEGPMPVFLIKQRKIMREFIDLMRMKRGPAKKSERVQREFAHRRREELYHEMKRLKEAMKERQEREERKWVIGE